MSVSTQDDELVTKTVLKEELEVFGQKISKQITDDITEVLNQIMTRVDERFNKLEVSVDRLTNTIDGFVKRLDDIETDLVARDAQYRRLLDWAQKVSVKTGIPLEY